jgi:hypothetical protein
MRIVDVRHHQKHDVDTPDLLGRDGGGHIARLTRQSLAKHDPHPADLSQEVRAMTWIRGSRPPLPDTDAP